MEQATTRHIFRRASTFLSLCGLVLAFNLFIFSMPGIGIGLWPQSETAISALHACAALCAIALILRTLPQKKPPHSLKHPLVILPLGIGILSLALLPFHILPMRSFLGSVRIGESPLSWLSIALLTASTLSLWRIKLYRSILVILALTGFALSYGLNIAHTYTKQPFTPFFFADYQAFNIIALFPLAFLLLKDRISNKAILYIILYGLLNILTYATANRFMMAFTLIAPPALLVFWKIPIPTKQKEKLELASIIALPFLGIGAFLTLPHISALGKGFYDFTDIGLMQTIASRAYLMDTAIRPIFDTPISFITGNGWGSFVEHIPRYLPLDWLNLSDQNIIQWDGLTSDHFHSHNMFLETLNCIGILGMFLLIFYISAFYIHSKKKMKKTALIFSLGFVAWASSWFFMPPNWPFLAICAAALAKGSYLKIPHNKTLITAILSSTAALLITGSYITYMTAYRTSNYSAKSIEIVKDDNFESICTPTYNDFNAGGLHLSTMLLKRLRYTTHLVQQNDQDEPIEPHIKELTNLFCETDHYLDSKPASARLKGARLIARGEVLLGLTPHLSELEKQYYLHDWKQDLEEWLEIMPQRTDQAVPYLLYHIISEQEEASQPVKKTIIKNNPDDPVGLWFQGLSLLKHPERTQEGLTMMKLSLKNGIERYMPIEPELLQMLK